MVGGSTTNQFMPCFEANRLEKERQRQRRGAVEAARFWKNSPQKFPVWKKTSDDVYYPINGYINTTHIYHITLFFLLYIEIYV